MKYKMKLWAAEVKSMIVTNTNERNFTHVKILFQ